MMKKATDVIVLLCMLSVLCSWTYSCVRDLAADEPQCVDCSEIQRDFAECDELLTEHYLIEKAWRAESKQMQRSIDDCRRRCG